MASIEQLTKWPLAKKLAVLAVAMIVLGAGFWFVYYQPVMDELESLKSKHSKLKRDLVEAEKRKKTYEDDRRKRDELKKAASLQLQVLPPKAEIASFLNNLNTQADLVGLEILSVKPRDEQAAQYYARIPVRLKLRGSFHQLAKFFYLVGNLDRIINIENINLKSAVMDDSGVVLVAEVLATTFRSVQPQAKKGKKGKKGKK